VGEQYNLQAIHKVYDAFGHGAVEGVIYMLTDDVTWTTPGPPDVIAYAGERRGHDEVTGYFEASGASTETTAFEPQNFVADGDFVHTFQLADGKISAFEGYEDSAAVVAAFTAGSN